MIVLGYGFESKKTELSKTSTCPFTFNNSVLNIPIKRAERTRPEVYDSNGQGWTDRSGSQHACQ